MDEKYIQDLWNWTTQQDPTFTDRYTFDSWKEKIGANEEYRQQFHGWVSSIDNSFSERRPLKQWTELVKKKDQPQQVTESVSADGSSDSQESDPRDMFVGGEILFDTSPTKEEDAQYQEFLKAKEKEYDPFAPKESEADKKLQEFYSPKKTGIEEFDKLQVKQEEAKQFRDKGDEVQAQKVEKEIEEEVKEEFGSEDAITKEGLAVAAEEEEKMDKEWGEFYESLSEEDQQRVGLDAYDLISQFNKGEKVIQKTTKKYINKPQQEYDRSFFKYNNEVIEALQEQENEQDLFNYTSSLDNAERLNEELKDVEKKYKEYIKKEEEKKKKGFDSEDSDIFGIEAVKKQSEYHNKIVNLREDIYKNLWNAQGIERKNTLDPELGEQDAIDYFPDMVDDVVSLEGNEASIVSQSNQALNQYGFTFKGSGGAFSDDMIVTSANGKSIEIELPNNSSDLRTFLEENRRASEIKYIKSSSTRHWGSKPILRKEKRLVKKEDVETELKMFQDRVALQGRRTQALLTEEAKFSNEADEWAKRVAVEGETPELVAQKKALEEKQKEITATKNKLIEYEDTFKNEGEELDRMAGAYYLADADNGSFIGTTATHIKEGIGSIAADAVYLGLTIPYLIDKGVNFLGGGNFHILPANMLIDNYSEKFKEKAEEMGYNPSSMSEEDVDKVNTAVRESALQTTLYGEEQDVNPYSKYTNQVLAEQQGGVLNDVRDGFRNAFGEMSSRAYDEKFTQTFWGQVWAGTATSLPAMLSILASAPAAATKVAVKKGLKESLKRGVVRAKGLVNPKRQWAMFMQTQDMLNQEMNANPELRNVPEEEKFVLGSIIGLTTSVLEDLGLSSMLKNKGFINGVILRAAGKSGITSSAKTLEQVIREDVKNMIGRMGLTAGAGFAAEFETGALQEVADISVKELYDVLKDKDYFDNPAIASADFFNQTLYAGVQEGAGAFILGTPKIISAAKRRKNFTDITDAQWNLYTNIKDNPKFLSMQKLHLEGEVKNKNLSADEARSIYNEYQNVNQAFESIPKNLRRKEQQEALGLILNRKQLEDKKRDKNPLLAKQEDAEIAEIDKRLAVIGDVSAKRFKTKKDAVQKQSTTDMDADKQTADVQEMVEGKPTTEPEVVTKEEVKDKGKKVTEEGKQPPYRKLQQTEIVELNREKNDLQSLEVRSGLNETQAARLNEIQSILQGEAQADRRMVEVVTKEEVKDEGKELTEEAFKEFTDTGKVSEKVVDNISEKVKEGKPLTKEEEAIRQDKSTEIEEKLKETVVQEGTDITKVEEVKKIKEKVKPPVKKVLQETQRVHKKIKDVLPDFEVVVHETEEGYNKQMKSVDGPEGSEGLFTVPKTPDGKYTGRIDINLSKASGRTVSHEIAHGVMLKEFGKNQRTFKNVQKKLLDVLSDEQVVELNDFVKQYKETEQPEEFLAEMSALLTESGDRLSQKGLKKIMAVIAEFISKYTGGKIKVFKDAASTKEVADFFNSVSDAISRGEQVSVKETVAVKETPKETVVKEEVKEEVKEAPQKEVVEEAPIEEVVEEKVVEEAPAEEVVEEEVPVTSPAYVGELLNKAKELIELSKTRKMPLIDKVRGATFDEDFDAQLMNQIGDMTAFLNGITDTTSAGKLTTKAKEEKAKVNKKDYVKFLRLKKELHKAKIKLHKDELKNLDSFSSKATDAIIRGVVNPIFRQKENTRAEAIAYVKEEIKFRQKLIQNLDARINDEVKEEVKTPTKSLPEQIAEGKLSIEGVSDGYMEYVGDPAVGDTRGEGGKDGLRETIKDGKKIFTLSAPTRDGAGRPGNYSISLTYPADTDVTLDDVSGKLEAMNKRFTDNAQGDVILGTLNQNAVPVSVEEFVKLGKNKSDFNFEAYSKDATKPTVRARKSAQEGPELTPKDFREAKAASKESLQEQIEIEDLKEIASKAVLQRRDKTKNITAISNRIRDLQEEKKLLKESPEFVIADNLPKVNPKSAARETGEKVGTRGGIPINLTSKKAGSVEAAAEYFGTNGELEGLLGYDAGLEDQDIRNIIIEILLKGKKKFKSDILEDVNNDIRNQRDRKKYLQKQKPVTKAKQIESVNNFVMDSRNQGYSDSSIKAALNSYDIAKAVIDDALNIPTTGFQQESRLSREQLQERIREISKGKKVKLSAATVKNIAGKINKAKLSLKDGSINEKEVSNIINYIEGQYDKASDRAFQIQEKNKQLRKDRREKAKKIKQEKKDASGLEKKRKKLVKPRIDAVLGRPNDVISTDLKRLFARDSKTIPASVREEYTALVNMFAVPKTVRVVLPISKIQENLNTVNDAIDMRDGNLEILKNAYESFEDKVLDDKGKINYAATLERMVAKGDITEADAELMKKLEYKNVIYTPTEKTQEEKEESKKEKEQREKEEKASLIKNIRGFEIDAKQVLKTQRDKGIRERMRDNIESLKALIQTSSLDALSNSELKTLQSSMQSINNGTFNHAAYEILNTLRADLKGKLIKDLAVEGIKYKSKGGKLDKLSDISFEIDSMVNKLFVDSALRKEMQNNPLGMLELMLGLKVGKGLNEVLLEDAASEQQQLTLETRKIQESLSELQVKLQEDTGTNNKFLEASYEVMTYLINQEVVTNEGNTQMVKDGATAFLDETIKFTKTNKNLNKRTKDVTISILNNVKNKQPKTLTEESVREQREKLTPLQRRIVQEVQKINQDLAPKAAYTAAVIRGKNFSSRPDYVHLHVRKQPDSEMEDLENRRKQFSKKPSTKSVTLEDRTGSANPLNFDIFTSVFRGATQTLEDYYLTPSFKEGFASLKKAMNTIEEEIKDRKIKTEKVLELVQSLETAFEIATEQVMGYNQANTLGDGFVSKRLKKITKNSYRIMLSGVTKGMSEYLGNTAVAAGTDLEAFKMGQKLKGLAYGEEFLDILKNSKSKEIVRLVPKGLGGRLVDRQTAQEDLTIKPVDPKGKYVLKFKGKEITIDPGAEMSVVAKNIKAALGDDYNKIKVGGVNLSGRDLFRGIASLQDNILTVPDKAVMRPMWIGSFVKSLEKTLGKKFTTQQAEDILRDIADGGEFFQQNREAIKKAKIYADRNVVLVGNTANPFMGIQKGKRAGGLKRQTADEVINIYNNFLVSFMKGEWASFRLGRRMYLEGNAEQRKLGGFLMATTVLRVATYRPVMLAIGGVLTALIYGSDDDDDDAWWQELNQVIASTFVSLILGRGKGQLGRMGINYAYEDLNRRFGEGIMRSGEYDAYKNSIAYSAIPTESSPYNPSFNQLLRNVSGPLSPLVSTVMLATKLADKEEPKGAEAKKRYKREITERLPFELLGLLGAMPFYKDLRPLLMKRLYGDMSKDKQGGGSSSSPSKKTKSKSIDDMIDDSSVDDILDDSSMDDMFDDSSVDDILDD